MASAAFDRLRSVESGVSIVRGGATSIRSKIALLVLKDPVVVMRERKGDPGDGEMSRVGAVAGACEHLLNSTDYQGMVV